MLDEILENKQYTCKFNDFFKDPCKQKECAKCDVSICPFRLNYVHLNDDFRGIRRALEIRARAELYKKSKKEPDIKRAEEECKKWLRNHFGFEYLALVWPAKETPDPEGDFPKEFDEKKDDLLGFRTRFKKKMFGKTESASNDINAITYEKIIAAALTQGPLKTYYLKAKVNPDKLTLSKQKKGVKSTKVTPGEKDYLLKLTAAFLLEEESRKSNSPDPKSYTRQYCLHISEVDVLNWGISRTTKNPAIYFMNPKTHKQEIIVEKEYITNLSTNKEIKKNNKGNNLVKFRFNKYWIDNFSLVDVTTPKKKEQFIEKFESQDEKNRWVYYEDQGSKRELILHK